METCIARPRTRTGRPGRVSGSLRASSMTVAASPAGAPAAPGAALGHLPSHGHSVPHAAVTGSPTRTDPPGPGSDLSHPADRGRWGRATYDGVMADQRGRVLLADPRGDCAGVDPRG